MGGHESEHDVSLKSGQTALRALSAHNPLPVIVDKDLQTWHLQQPMSAEKALVHLKSSVDVALLMLHGPFGEDGTIQGAMETVGLPYTGSDVFASATAMSKSVSGLLFKEAGLKTPEFVSFTKYEAEKYHPSIETLGFPLVIKPENGGSSVGIRFVSSWGELVEAVEDNSFTDFIAQEQITGRELTCGVIDIDGKPEALPITEIKPGNDYFDYESKYTPGASEEITPADLTPEDASAIKKMAIKAHRLLGCSGITRSDFIHDEASDTLYLLELNTAPGMTGTSLVPQEIEAAGKELGEVLEALCKQRSSQ